MFSILRGSRSVHLALTSPLKAIWRKVKVGARRATEPRSSRPGSPDEWMELNGLSRMEDGWMTSKSTGLQFWINLFETPGSCGQCSKDMAIFNLPKVLSKRLDDLILRLQVLVSSAVLSGNPLRSAWPMHYLAIIGFIYNFWCRVSISIPHLDTLSFVSCKGGRTEHAFHHP